MKKKIFVTLFLVLAITVTACSPSTPTEPDKPQEELEEYIDSPPR